MTQVQTEPTVVADPRPDARDINAAATAAIALSALFFLAERTPWALRLLKPIAVRLALRYSDSLTANIQKNAKHLFGRESSAAGQRDFARDVVGNFYDFVVDVGRSVRVSVRELESRIESIDGREGYHRVRATGRGAIFVTAHMGCFEVGLAALRQMEPKVHVVFKRDLFERFERIRSRVRGLLDVTEAPIDDGLHALMRLRDALLANEVVVMQADRAMPGQRSQIVPFLHGRMRLPLGPVRLAQLTGSPIIPVFLVRGERGGFSVHMSEPIEVDPQAEPIEGVDPALRAIARAIESFVARYPGQWLVLHRAFVGDECE